MISNDDIPMGLGMALMKNPSAFTAFAHMSDEEKQSVISNASTISSKQEMQSYVNNIFQDNTNFWVRSVQAFQNDILQKFHFEAYTKLSISPKDACSI